MGKGKGRTANRRALLRGASRVFDGAHVTRVWPSIGTDGDRLREDWNRLGQDFHKVAERHRRALGSLPSR